MFNTVAFSSFPEHLYTLDATGLKIKSEEFSTRQLAEKRMYKIMKKNHLHIEEIYDDKHSKTYLCNNGVRFYISRF